MYIIGTSVIDLPTIIDIPREPVALLCLHLSPRTSSALDRITSLGVRQTKVAKRMRMMAVHDAEGGIRTRELL